MPTCPAWAFTTGMTGSGSSFASGGDFFAEYHAEPQQFIAADDNVMVRVTQTGRGRASSVGVEMPAYWQVYRLRDGRAVRVEIYRDETDALAAIGLAK